MLPMALLATSVALGFSGGETVVLSPNETALIELPWELYGARVNGTTKASIVSEEDVQVVFESSPAGGNWRLGAAVSTLRGDLVAVHSGDTLELWRVSPYGLRPEWQLSGKGEIAGLQTQNYDKSTVLLFWTRPDLSTYFVDLTEWPFTARAVSGVDTTGASAIVLCGQSNALATVAGRIVTSYLVDLAQLAASPLTQTEVPAEIVAAACTDDFYCLTDKGLYVLRDWSMMQFSLPSALGKYSKLQVSGGGCAAVGEKGLVYITEDG